MREKGEVYAMGSKSRVWYLCIVLILLLGVGGGNQAWAAGNATFTVGSTSYYMDGAAQNMDVAPYIKDGRTYVPILYLAQAIGISANNVVWDTGNATITLLKGDQAVQMQIGNKTLLVNGAARQMDVAPEISSGRTFLPASFIAQGFGYSVDWDAASQTIKLYQGSSPSQPVSNKETQVETEPKTWEDWPEASTDDPNHPWTIVFKQAMDTSTINSSNIYVSPDIDGSRRIDGVGITASDSTHALVSPPTGGWKAETKYYLIITKKVLTSEGEPLKDIVRMPFSLTDAEVVLTPDYFVPDDISKIYVVSFSSSNHSYNRYIKWKGTKKYTYNIPDFDDRNCVEDVYAIDGNELKWISQTLYSNGNRHCNTCTSGSYVLIKPVSVGEKWDINYVTEGQVGPRTWTGKGQFVGRENITVMGSNMECAHVRISETSRDGSFVYDYWLVKGIGVVKVIYGPNGSTGELIEIR
jgi:hypothetical protein